MSVSGLKDFYLKFKKAFALPLGLAFLGFVALECWRPCFFLTDDSLTEWFPLAVDACRAAWSGHNPFMSPWLFGGHYRVLLNPIGLTLLNPVMWLASPLALTPFYFGLREVIEGFNLLLGTVSFLVAARYFRREHALTLSDGQLNFLALSYMFNPFTLTIGSSWFGYLGCYAVLPLQLLGLWHGSRKYGMVWITAASLYGLFGGHPHPFTFMVFFFGLLAGLTALLRGQMEPIVRWGIAVGIAMLISAPLTVPALLHFDTASRASGLNVEEMSACGLSGRWLLISMLCGGFTPWLTHVRTLFELNVFGSGALAASAAAWLVWLEFSSPRRRLSAHEQLVLLLFIVSFVFVARSDWLSALLLHVPILKSSRWPFREIALLQVFLHFFLLFRVAGKPRRMFWSMSTVGVVGLIVSLSMSGPPTLNPMARDRELIFSGRAAAFWSKVQAVLPADAKIVPVADNAYDAPKDLPFSLLGAYNYPTLFHVPSWVGYSTTPEKKQESQPRPYHHGGVITSVEWARLRAVRNDIVAVEVKKKSPLTIQVTTKDQRFEFGANE